LSDAPSAKSVPVDLVCRLDEYGVVLDTAGGGASFPWSTQELRGRALASALPPAAGRELIAALSAVRAAGLAVAIQFALPAGSGATHLEVRVAPDGDATFLAVLRDIGADRQDLLDLTSQRAFLRQVLDLDPSLIFAKDRDGRFTLANRAVASIYGVTPSALVGKTDADFNPDVAEIEHFRTDDLLVMNSLRPMMIAKEPVTSPDGGTRWFQTIKIPIVSPDGTANAVLGVSADITSRKEAEDILERRTAELLRHHTALRELASAGRRDMRTALEQILSTASRTLGVARTGVWLLDADRTSLRAECVFDHGAISDEPTHVFQAHDFPHYFRALAAERVVAATDAQNDPRTGTLRGPYLAALGITSMLDAAILSHGTMIGVVCHEHRGVPRVFTLEERDFAASIADVVSLTLEESKRLALEEQLRHAQKMEAIGLLAGGISHDFNNLLNIIVGYAELSAKALPGDHPAAAHVAKITDACTRAAELVRKILTFARGHVLRVEPLEFGGVLRDFSTLVTRVLGEDIELVVSSSDEAMIVEADRTQLEQILLNLCTNARQAMPQGGRLSLDARPVDVVEGAPGRAVHLQVSDTGHGIDETTMSRLWEPFFTTKREGTGLGLSMVYGIVRQHGGTIRAESRVGHGSTFHVYLPLHGETMAQHPEPAPAPELRGRETILIAEDELLIRELLNDSLSDLGYTVRFAENGAEAADIFAAEPDAFDMVILDVVMPKLSGPEALTKMLAVRPDVRALFISGHAPESARLSEQLQVAGRAFLAKPFLLDALATKVRYVLDTKR